MNHGRIIYIFLFQGTIHEARGHNARTCEVKKDDAIKKAVEEGTVPIIAKSTCVCKICNQPGHNSRTCKVKKQKQQGASINGLKPSNIVSVKQLFCGQHCIMTALEVNTLTLCQ
ncbi:hypothetical protein POM88_029430 [Heracleum sosnowskyi]|uniref:CCHC-type domain-containing protein n=1 Tax=Heracleum sosnowskyi TaxID=360622 RepID=A0AAD8HTL9_9APIA|nr:hypothetical protein POM88_029430 [Heracleum sosnowskyi]